MDPVHLPELETKAGTVPLRAEDQYAELIKRLLISAFNYATWATTDILKLAYRSGTAWPERRDIAAFERTIVALALEEASERRWCNQVHDELEYVFSSMWRYYPNGESPLFINDRFHHPHTGLAWDGSTDSWHVRCRAEDADAGHCSCGHMCTDVCRRSVGVLRSSHGHTFVSTDTPREDSCLTCGALFTLLVGEDGYDYYVGGNGERATECSGDTSMIHGEAPCDTCEGDALDDDGTCSHTNHDCNCLLCRF